MTARAVLEKRFPAAAARLGAGPVAAGRRENPRTRSRDWAALLDRWIGGLELRPGMALAVLGLGDGSHAERLLAALPTGCFVFCGEPDLGVLAAFLEEPGAERLLADGRFFLGAGPVDEVFFEAMGRFPVLDVTSAQPVIFAPLYCLDERTGSLFFQEFARQLDYWRKLFGTNVVSSGKWQGNTLANLPYLFDAPDLSELAGAFAGRTMVLASAGPSLDESLDFIRGAKDRAVVVAVNSSYRALRNAGIAPHFVIAADPFGDTAKGFRGVETAGTRLVCPFMVCPEVARLFAGRAVTWSEGNLLASYLRLKIGLPLGARVVEQGTVSACAFDLARAFGCSELVLVGQDLAILASGQSHAKDSFYSDEGANRADVEKCRRFPGNTLESVFVEEKLHVYLKTFQQLVRKNASWLRVVNTSRLGARIEGAPYEPLDQAALRVERGGGEIGVLYKEAVERVFSREGQWARARQELERLRVYVRGACSQALRIAMGLEIAEGEGSAALGVELRRSLPMKETLADHLESCPDYWRILSEGALKYELTQHVREIRELDRSGAAEEATARELRSYCWAVAEGAYRFLSDAEESEPSQDALSPKTR